MPIAASILAPLSAHDVLLLVQPFGVIGVSIGDLADPTTWTFDDGDTKAAQQALVDALVAPVVPDPVTVLEARMDALTDHVTTIDTNVQALTGKLAPAPVERLPPTV